MKSQVRPVIYAVPGLRVSLQDTSWDTAVLGIVVPSVEGGYVMVGKGSPFRV